MSILTDQDEQRKRLLEDGLPDYDPTKDPRLEHNAAYGMGEPPPDPEPAAEPAPETPEDAARNREMFQKYVMDRTKKRTAEDYRPDPTEEPKSPLAHAISAVAPDATPSDAPKSQYAALMDSMGTGGSGDVEAKPDLTHAAGRLSQAIYHATNHTALPESFFAPDPKPTAKDTLLPYQKAHLQAQIDSLNRGNQPKTKTQMDMAAVDDEIAIFQHQHPDANIPEDLLRRRAMANGGLKDLTKNEYKTQSADDRTKGREQSRFISDRNDADRNEEQAFMHTLATDKLALAVSSFQAMEKSRSQMQKRFDRTESNAMAVKVKDFIPAVSALTKIDQLAGSTDFTNGKTDNMPLDQWDKALNEFVPSVAANLSSDQINGITKAYDFIVANEVHKLFGSALTDTEKAVADRLFGKGVRMPPAQMALALEMLKSSIYRGLASAQQGIYAHNAKGFENFRKATADSTFKNPTFSAIRKRTGGDDIEQDPEEVPNMDPLHPVTSRSEMDPLTVEPGPATAPFQIRVPPGGKMTPEDVAKLQAEADAETKQTKAGPKVEMSVGMPEPYNAPSASRRVEDAVNTGRTALVQTAARKLGFEKYVQGGKLAPGLKLGPDGSVWKQGPDGQPMQIAPPGTVPGVKARN